MIVGLDAIAIGERGANGSGRRRRANAEMNRRRRIPHEHIGGMIRGLAVDGRVARKPREHRGRDHTASLKLPSTSID